MQVLDRTGNCAACKPIVSSIACLITLLTLCHLTLPSVYHFVLVSGAQAFGVPDVEPEFSSKSLRNRMSSSLLKSHAAQYNPFSVVHADASKAAAANSAKKPTAGARAVIADTATRPAGAAMTDAVSRLDGKRWLIIAGGCSMALVTWCVGRPRTRVHWVVHMKA